LRLRRSAIHVDAGHAVDHGVAVTPLTSATATGPNAEGTLPMATELMVVLVRVVVSMRSRARQTG